MHEFSTCFRFKQFIWLVWLTAIYMQKRRASAFHPWCSRIHVETVVLHSHIHVYIHESEEKNKAAA